MQIRLAQVVEDLGPLEQVVKERPLCGALHFLVRAMSGAGHSDALSRMRDLFQDDQIHLFDFMLLSRFYHDKALHAVSSDFIASLTPLQLNQIDDILNTGQRDLLTIFIELYKGWDRYADALPHIVYKPEGVVWPRDAFEGPDNVNEDGAGTLTYHDPFAPKMETIRDRTSGARGGVQDLTPPVRLHDLHENVLATLDRIEGDGWPRSKHDRVLGERLRAAIAPTPAQAQPSAPPSTTPQDVGADLPTAVPMLLAELGYTYQRLSELLETHGIELHTLSQIETLHAKLVQDLSNALDIPS